MSLAESGAVLAYSSFPTGAQHGAVAQDVLDRLVLTYCVLAAILGSAAVAVLRRFPLGEHDHQDRLARLAEIASHAAPLPGNETESAATAR